MNTTVTAEYWWKYATKPFEKDFRHRVLKVQSISLPLWAEILTITGDWYKIFDIKSGHNRTLGKKWGCFEIRQDYLYITLKYLDWPIVDHLRIMKDENFIGRFFYKGKFKGWFLLMEQGQSGANKSLNQPSAG